LNQFIWGTPYKDKKEYQYIIISEIIKFIRLKKSAKFDSLIYHGKQSIILILVLFIFGLLLYFLGYKRFFLKKIKNFMKCLGVVSSVLGYKYQDYK